MALRTRIVIAVISVLAALGVFVPLARSLHSSLNRPEVVITIPPDALHSPLPYSTPLALRHTDGSTAPAMSSITFQAPPTKLKKPGDGTVDINTAGLSELERLPGIGPAMAARILTERASIGRFRKPSDLREVRGIGPKKYSKMEAFITVS